MDDRSFSWLIKFQFLTDALSLKRVL